MPGNARHPLRRWVAPAFTLLVLCTPTALAAEATDCANAGISTCTAALEAAAEPAEKARLLVGRARLLRHDGDLKGAESDLAQAQALAPGDAAALIELGHLKRAEDDREAALAAYAKALDLDPQNWRALLNHMDMLADIGRNRECLAEAPHALEIAPEEARTYAYRGRCRAGTGETALAVEDYRKAAGMGLDEAFLYANLALAELDLGRNEAALADAEAAIGRDAANAYGQYGRIDALLQLGRLDDALAAYPQAIAAIGKDTLGLANLVSWTLYRNGRARDALPVIEGFFHDHPQPGAAQVYEVDTYAHILSALGYRDKALSQFLRAADLGGTEKEAVYRRRLAALRIEAGPGRENLAAALGKCVEMGGRCRLSE